MCAACAVTSPACCAADRTYAAGRSSMNAEHCLSVLIPRNLPPAADPVRLLLDAHVPWMTHGELFSEQSFGVGPWPEQGWKLHVSATALSAVEVFARALPVLLDEGVRFKVV